VRRRAVQRAPESAASRTTRRRAAGRASRIKDNFSPRTRRARHTAYPLPRSRVKAGCSPSATPLASPSDAPDGPCPEAAGHDEGMDGHPSRPATFGPLAFAGYDQAAPEETVRGNRHWWDQAAPAYLAEH